MGLGIGAKRIFTIVPKAVFAVKASIVKLLQDEAPKLEQGQLPIGVVQVLPQPQSQK